MTIPDKTAADELKLVPSLALKEEYNDNILYTTTDTIHDYVTTISPGLLLSNRTERMDLNLSGRLDRLLYSKYSELDSTDQFYEGTGKYSVTERLTLFGKALYSRDSRPDRDLEITGVPLGPVIRHRQNYGISSTYALSDKTLSTLSYEYLKDNYDSAFYVDSDSHTFNLGLTHDLSYYIPSTKGRINFIYARYNMSGFQADKVDNYEMTVGLAKDFTEKWNLVVDGGARYTDWKYKVSNANETVFDPTTPPFFFPVFTEQEKTSREWGAVAQMTLNYKGERGTGSLAVSHDIAPPTGRTGSVERTSVVLKTDLRFMYELYGMLSTGYFLNKSSQGDFTSKVDEETIWIAPGIRYQWNKDASIEFTYSYNKTWYHTVQENADRNLFLVRLRIQHDLLN